MKKFDWTVFFPGQVTFLLLPGELIGVRSVHVGGRGRSTHARSWACADREALSRSLLAAREELDTATSLMLSAEQAEPRMR